MAPKWRSVAVAGVEYSVFVGVVEAVVVALSESSLRTEDNERAAEEDFRYSRLAFDDSLTPFVGARRRSRELADACEQRG